jgi:hypothetical protein
LLSELRVGESDLRVRELLTVVIAIGKSLGWSFFLSRFDNYLLLYFFEVLLY